MSQEKALHGYTQAIIDLAKVFSSPFLLGPPMGEPLLRLVNHLFTPEEALVARHIPAYLPASPERIAKRAKMHPSSVMPLLDAMAEKRVIWTSPRGYCLLPLIPGMFEYMLMDGRDSAWHRTYARLINELCSSGYSAQYYRRSSPLIRNIPIDDAVQATDGIVDEISVEKMIDSHEKMAILNVCQCRQSLAFDGKPCRRADVQDGCLVFGGFADTVVERKSGRYVTKDEMRAVVRERCDKNLVFMTANVSHAGPNAICTCCSCCCHYLESVNRFGGRSSLAQPAVLARVDENMCIACGACVDACNVFAHTLEEGAHRYNPLRCIGCGLCMRSCPTGAIALRPNPDFRRPDRNWLFLTLRNLPRTLAGLLEMRVRRAFSLDRDMP